MQASWCWRVVEMTLSDATSTSGGWSANALLNAKEQTPQFLRTDWDEVRVRSFGPWRIADRSEPTDGLTAPAPLPTSAEDVEVLTSETLEPNEAVEDAQEDTRVSEAALVAMREEAYQQGLQAGLAQVHAEMDAERAKERELIRHLGIELRSISQDPQRFFEPLKRLSLHLAEQLVRAELQISGQAIHGLIQACIQQLDHPAAPVQVSLNPEDLQRLKSMGAAVTTDLQLDADPLLRSGSVRVRVQDTVVQDLIENRLEPLARRLLPEPEAWLQRSSLVQDRVEPLPEDTPKRDWNRQVIDVQDTELKAAAAELPDEDTPS